MNLPDFWIQVASSNCNSFNLGFKPLHILYIMSHRDKIIPGEGKEWRCPLEKIPFEVLLMGLTSGVPIPIKPAPHNFLLWFRTLNSYQHHLGKYSTTVNRKWRPRANRFTHQLLYTNPLYLLNTNYLPCSLKNKSGQLIFSATVNLDRACVLMLILP